MNHYKRDVSAVVERLKSIGVQYKVFTDYSDYKDTRDENRYKGLKDNYMSILRYTTPHTWKLIMHDDMSISDDLFYKIDYILERSFKSRIISFFHPTNKGYRMAVEKGHHVVKTYSNFWLPCHAFPSVLEAAYISFYDRNEQRLKKYSEDAVLCRYLSHYNLPVYVVTPSLSQHDGFDKSLFNNPSKCGKNERKSFAYDPNFNAYSVDWNMEFNSPFVDSSRLNFNDDDGISW
jgi:hypothetical protein